MTIITPIRRPLGTMIVYGYPGADLAGEMAIAQRIGATHLEILPDWRVYPDPTDLITRAADSGLTIHSAHGCWGGQTIQARQVDLASLDPTIRAESVADIRACVDWLHRAGGSFLVVHPGGLSEPADQPARRDVLVASLAALAPLAAGAGVMLCVENMPPGVHPGSSMADLAAVVAEVDSPSVALAMDTGHAFLTATHSGAVDPGLQSTTQAAGRWLATTHVHDNNGRQDVHWSPGAGGIDWDGWVRHLDAIDYRGPILLECIRHLRQHPKAIDEAFLDRLRKMTWLERS